MAGLRLPLVSVMAFASLLILALGGTIVSSPGPAIILAASAPLLMLGDVLRYLRIAQGKATQALVYDLLWLLLETVAFGLCLIQGAPTASDLTFAFVLAGLLPLPLLAGSGASTDFRFTQAVPSPWWTSHRRSVVVFSYEAFWQGLWANASGILLIGTAGVAALAGFRRAQAPVLPAIAAFSAYGSFLASTSLIYRVQHTGKQRLLLVMPALIPAALALGFAIGPRLILVPIFGHQVAEEHVATSVLLIGASGSGLALVDSLRVRASKDLRFLGRFRTVAAPAETAAVVIGGLTGGARGAVVGYALANIANAVIFRLRARSLNDSLLESKAPSIGVD